MLAIDLGVKTLATGVNEQGRFYHINGFKGGRWYCRQLDKIRSKRDRCKKGSRRYKHLSQVYKRVSQQKRNKQQDSLHKASHLIAHKLVERTVVVGDLSQRQMVMKEHRERNKYLNRAVFNEWGLYTFIQMLLYKCQLYVKCLQSYMSAIPPKLVVAVAISKPCHSGKGHTIGKNVDSLWIETRIPLSIS